MGWHVPRGLRGHGLTSFEGMFLSADEAFCETVGRNVATLRKLSILDVTHAGDRTPNHHALERLRLTGEPFEITKRYVDEDGKAILVRNHVSRFKDGLGPDRLVAAVEVMSPTGVYPTEHDHLALARLLQTERRMRPARRGARRWGDIAWSLLLATFALEEEGQPALLRDICAAANHACPEGNLHLLELLAEDWIDLDFAAETLEESSAVLTLKGRTLLTQHLSAMIEFGLTGQHSPDDIRRAQKRAAPRGGIRRRPGEEPNGLRPIFCIIDTVYRIHLSKASAPLNFSKAGSNGR